MLNGKVAVVTGGSRGIGAAIAAKLAALGADIAILYVGDPAEAEAACEECRKRGSAKVQAYVCDVSDFNAVKNVVAQVKADFGTIHILINNAGITRDNLIAVMSEAEYDAVLNVNLKGAFNMIRHCAGIFIRNRGGSIVNISSVSGLMGNAGQINYAASKAGLVGLTKSVAKELAPRGVRCNAVAPGFIDTDMTRALGDANADKLKTMIPLGHTGKPDDVADAVVFLACAEYITGEVLRVDGGIAM